MGGDAYTAPVAVINGEDHYLHRDHLGSILAISNAAGTAVEERHFTPWGELDALQLGGQRFSGIASSTAAFAHSLVPRGFTGHEHFGAVNLIHMNGRLYDPRLKRFLAPDNNIVNPYDPRYYDRYAYALNNPLMVVDPSGEDPLTLAVIIKTLKVIYAIYKVADAIEGYASKRYTGPLPGIFAAVAVAGGLDAAGLVDVPFMGAGDLNLKALGLCDCSELTAIAYDFLISTVIPEAINQIMLHQFNQDIKEQQQQFALNSDEENFLDPPNNVQNINTSDVMTGGSGPFVPETCLLNCDEAADGTDDSENDPMEECFLGNEECEEEPTNPCGTGFVQDIDGNCVEMPCPGDPVPNPQIAPQKGPSGILGGMYGCNRFGGTCAGEDGRNKSHKGIDLKAEYGEPIFAMYDGFVYSTGFDEEEAGYMVLIQSTVNEDTILQEYFHLQDENRVSLNSDNTLNYVKAGDIIGYLGDSGNLSGAIAKKKAESHVHLKIKKHDGSTQWNYNNNFTTVDPRDYLKTIINDDGTTEQENTNCN